MTHIEWAIYPRNMTETIKLNEGFIVYMDFYDLLPEKIIVKMVTVNKNKICNISSEPGVYLRSCSDTRGYY